MAIATTQRCRVTVERAGIRFLFAAGIRVQTRHDVERCFPRQYARREKVAGEVVFRGGFTVLVEHPGRRRNVCGISYGVICHDFRTVLLFFVRRRWVLGEVPAFRDLGCEVCLPVVITPRIAAVLDGGRARRRALRLDLRNGGLFGRGAGVTRPDTGVRGRQDAWFLRRYARAFDDLGADLREGRAPAPPVSPENRRVAAFRVVLVGRGRSRAANLPWLPIMTMPPVC
jgi:hypothetical protein